MKNKYHDYLTFPLVGCSTPKELNENIKYYGDFANIRKKREIFSKPRKFRVSILLNIQDTNDYEITELTIQSPVNEYQLGEILHQFANESLLESKYCIDKTRSYYKVII